MPKTKYILFTSGVDKLQTAKLREAIIRAVNDKYDELYFLISSSGGDVFEGLAVAALIHALPMKTVMHNIGQVDSVATAIFAAAKERISNANASFLFHGVSMNPNATSFLEHQLKELYDQARRMKADIANAISVYTGCALTVVESLMVDGASILSATQAQSKALINKIGEAQIPQGADIVNI